MPSPLVLDLRRADDTRDVVHRAVQALSEGQLVALPTETVYGLAANALDEAAVNRLLEAKGRRAGNPLTLALGSAEAALDYCPSMPVVARRLSRRAWPGPLTLVLAGDHPDSLLRRLPPGVQQAVMPGNTVGLRVPDHPQLLSVLQLLSGPLVLSSANLSGQPEAVTAEEVIAALGPAVDLVLSDGRSKYAQPSSVVRVDGRRVELLRSGVLSESSLRRYSSLMVLLVCTGNTCRSPMAQVLLQKRLADRLNCRVEELEQAGVMVLSAGVAAGAGGAASAGAIEAMQSRGLDLSAHESRPLNETLVRFADLILTMTRSHRDVVVSQWSEAADRTALLRIDRQDVSDPMGGDVAVYQHCADQIDAQLAVWVDRLDWLSLPQFVTR
jgi:protein-tyrosine phosphatase